MGNRYDDERYGRGHWSEDDRGQHASEGRHERDWENESDPEHRRYREMQGRDAQVRDDQRRWQQGRSPWPDYSARGASGYEGNRPRVPTLPEWRGGFEQAREDTRRRLEHREYGRHDDGWQGRSSPPRWREDLDRGRFSAGAEAATRGYGGHASGGYAYDRPEREPRTQEYAGYSGLYSGYGGHGEPGGSGREGRSREHEGWEADRAPWRSGGSERDAAYGDRNEAHPEHHRQGIAGAFDAIRGGIRNAFRGLKGYTRSDDRIREDVCDRINHLSEQHGMDVGDVEVRVHEGEVTLGGSIDNRQFKHRIENEAAGISGVKNVHNEIRVRQTSLNLEGRSTPSSTSTSTQTPTATATAGALSSGMIGTAGAPSTTERSRTPNGNSPPNGNAPPTNR